MAHGDWEEHMKDVPPLQPDWAVTPSARGLSLMSQVLTGLEMPDIDQAHDGLQQSLGIRSDRNEAVVFAESYPTSSE